jgi:isopenicillin-N epimerase
MTTMKLGKAIRHEWGLNWNWLHVNHGSFGATPRAVLTLQQDWRRRMEAEPGWFMHRVLPAALRTAAQKVGAFIGADAKDIVFVENATAGCNAVLRSIRLDLGDEVLVLSHGYNAVRNTVRYVTERAGARMIEAAVPFPRTQSKAILASIGEALTSRTRLAIIDHITSSSAFVLPINDVVAFCHSAGVPVLIDGAHGPGQLPLNLRATGADWYVGNCHKWLCAPKGCGFLWAAPERQPDLHPVTISHGFGKGFRAEFDWTGTADRTAFLCVGAAIDFHCSLGGSALMARNAVLAAEATALLCERLDVEPGSEGTLAGAMSVVRLPLAGSATQERAIALRERLLSEHADVPVHVIDGGLWIWISAHAYNEIDDYERLANILRTIC